MRDWLVSSAATEAVAAKRIWGAYADFQEWYWELKLAQGADEDEIREDPTSEVLAEMFNWRDSETPV